MCEMCPSRHMPLLGYLARCVRRIAAEALIPHPFQHPVQSCLVEGAAQDGVPLPILGHDHTREPRLPRLIQAAHTRIP